MLSVNEAKKLIKEKIKPLKSELKALSDVCGYALADDIYAILDVPSFPQSSMDGYAFKYESLAQFSVLKVIGKVQAGSEANIVLEPNEAVRIFTGAPVPTSADTVVMQEKTRVKDAQLFVLDEKIVQGTNVRGQGSEIKKGDLGLNAGQIISPAGIGFLASIGIHEVNVISKPKVSIIVTGDELQDIGHALSFGQVYESNSHTVRSALIHMGISEIQIFKVKDSLEELVKTLELALIQTDMILLTGGVSVGEYDFVEEATKICNVHQIFHKLKQKPGKPIYFGMKDNKVVFGLPGNPASVLTCFYQYVTIALDRLSSTDVGPKTKIVPMVGKYNKVLGMTHFLKGHFDGEAVTLMEGQESYKLNSFAKSNCLIEIPEEEIFVENLQKVLIHLI